MLINLKVKTLDAQTHEFSIDNEITVREFKDKVAEKTNIAADQQRIIYCGRVMVDDKQLKEYDVDGKVVHVAERPPPSQRLPATDSSASGTDARNERRNRARPNMRNSPLFRALDGMVVGTMAFPMNANTNGQAPVNPFAASSSFCMNRITVARHMLECANNIAAYLEDPSRGLNNQSLDILARGRWTMESTVVEVGITSDIPQSQQIVEMVQGAVQAALRRSGNTNVTLVQLPTVFSSNENEANAAAVTAAGGAAGAAATDTETANTEPDNAATTAASVVIEDVIDDDEDTPTNEPSDNNSTAAAPNAASAGDNNDNAAVVAGNNDDGGDNSRRRTGTPVLAGVIEQMRNVQNRLNPFIEQYYDLLQNEPTFEEDDTTGRENAQRLFDRVSEAFHYMSHAQHAISDLMLDVSQDAPRYLTCRPILVEQSGYVSSNNFLTPAFLTPEEFRQQQGRNTTNTNTAATATATPTTAAASTAATTTTNSSNPATGSSSTSSNDANNTVDDPIDDPVIWRPTINFGTPPSNDNTNASNNNANAAAGRVPAQGGGRTLEIILQPSRAMYLERNFQRQVARLLQDVVSAAPFDTEFHVHINTPNVVSIDVPIGVSGSSNSSSGGSGGGTQASQTTSTTLNNNDSNATTTSTATATNTTNDNANTNTTTNSSSSSSSSTANPARVTTATLPTTSTQTRSTSRPQVHFGNIPVLGMPTGWNGRVLPSNNVSSFDRFLPCNSHHIREPETANNNAANNDNGSNNATASGPATRNNPTRAHIVTRRPLRTMNDIFQRIRPHSSRIVGSTMRNPQRLIRNNFGSPSGAAVSVRPPILPPIMVMRDLFGGVAAASANGSSASSSSSTTADAGASSNQDTQRLNIHSQLMNCLNSQIFEGQPINDDTIPLAINRAIQWFGESLLYLPQYEKPEYDSRDSLFNILRSTLPAVIELLKRNPVNLKEFEQKLKQICEQFRKRLYSVLYICIGRANAEIFWAQLMRLLCNSIQTNLQGDVVEFLAVYLTPTIPSATDEADAQQFIVLRNTTAAANDNNVQTTFVSPPAYFHSQPMDTDVEMSETATTSQPEVDDEPLPSVVPGSVAWHRHFPNDWLPILTRDIQMQRDNPTEQPPFSDAYISGMSSKRRKLVQNSKPPTEIGAIIADSVRKAIQNPGLGTSTSANQSHTPEDVARAIASDAAVQSSCIDAVRTNVRERLKKDPDFEADKFPKSNKFIKK
ncbi:LOW QUALITY PROTEIN: large proline-rich protein BAG6 [Lucilia sericata]|uniref:LOW QUALITY PROTEIN: large proline-rich protein BAG6 n=1 Tax=Lucilia sericata TaxID=13632 RepID=UPI0018A83610|nr:LOW QUALITY PROTEIN: large proline-rich protein BAG6 [Lucilia sericata]